jgi:hypothetical protein
MYPKPPQMSHLWTETAYVSLSFVQKLVFSSSPPVLKGSEGNIDTADLRSDAVRLAVDHEAIRS